MATLHVVSALTKKHSEIQGEIQLMGSKLEDMHNTLEALETSIIAFDTAFDLSEIRLKKRLEKVYGLKRGEIPMIVGNYVRLADKDFVVADVVDYVFDQKKELDRAEWDKVKLSVTQALSRLNHRKLIVEVGRDSAAGTPIIWRSRA